MQSLRETVLKIKTTVPVLPGEPMSAHTTFRIGGPADFFARPTSRAEVLELSRCCSAEGIPLFVLGGGANILVSDEGIRGMVMDMGRLDGAERHGDALWAASGTPLDTLVSLAAGFSLSGLQSFSAMPGSVGGAVWMNARCYSVSISDVLDEVEYIDLREPDTVRRVKADPAQFAYKSSPFQSMSCIITGAGFRLRPGERAEIERTMREVRADRERKGHFRYPSAGSAFKNNPAFGGPTGAIIDSLGLKGFRVGDAAVADFHGNFIVNVAQARAADVLEVLRHVEQAVLEARGFRLEREILLVGDWDQSE